MHNACLVMSKKELILELGAEGGSICLNRIVMPEKIQFLVKTNESYLDDEYFSGEKSFQNLEEAVRHIYLNYPFMDLYILEIDPAYILPIALIIRENVHLLHRDFDKARATAYDKVFAKNIKQIKQTIWLGLSEQLNHVRKLLDQGSNAGENNFETHHAIYELYGQIHSAQIVNPFDWPHWDEGHWLLKVKETDFSQLDTITLCKLVTTIVRKDHFGYGVWERSIREGTMTKILAVIIQKNFHRQ